MSPGEAVLITGATGTIGSWIAAEALTRGMRVLTMVRGDEPHLARRRVLTALATAGAPPAARKVEVVLGDLCQEGLGLYGGTASAGVGYASLRSVSLICHCAAVVRFDDGESDLHQQTNVQGTAAVLELAEHLGAAVMHLSTAYVAGTRGGLVREGELDVGQTFNNGYERAKCQAEALVRDWSRRTARRAIILRPSIVLGDWTTGRTIHFHALYHYLRFADRTSAGRGDAAFRVLARPGATMNIVPVDYIARTAWDLVASGAAGAFHLTHPSAVRMDELSEMVSDIFGGLRTRLVDAEEFRRLAPTRLEQALSSMVASYQPYTQSEPVFDRTNIDAAPAGNEPPHAIDTAYLRRLIEYARQADWGR